MAVINKSTSKASILIFSFLLISNICLAQITNEDLAQNHKKTINTAMTVLGTWAGINIIGGSLASLNKTGPKKYFYQGNAYWNVVNLSLVGFSLYSLSKFPENPDLNYLLEENLSLQKLMLFNAGLDVAYMAGGFYLRERSLNSESRKEMFKGFGNALILQGAFLLVFDSFFYISMQKLQPQILDLISAIQIGPGQVFLALRF